MGRFISLDTIEIWGDLNNYGNGYSYVGNMGNALTDPLGTQSVEENSFADSVAEVIVNMGAGKVAGYATTQGIIFVATTINGAALSATAVCSVNAFTAGLFQTGDMSESQLKAHLARMQAKWEAAQPFTEEELMLVLNAIDFGFAPGVEDLQEINNAIRNMGPYYRHLKFKRDQAIEAGNDDLANEINAIMAAMIATAQALDEQRRRLYQKLCGADHCVFRDGKWVAGMTVLATISNRRNLGEMSTVD